MEKIELVQNAIIWKKYQKFKQKVGLSSKSCCNSSNRRNSNWSSDNSYNSYSSYSSNSHYSSTNNIMINYSYSKDRVRQNGKIWTKY